ncbi:hypothetical protein C8Q74DRAFT_1374616 [Fomes fomentarius]|nr:hypothetical protein C8Q74DRAFT_1374616 [Fomes fomentarius]
MSSLQSHDQPRVGNHTVTRDEHIWMHDGNVIIISADNIAFRVHLGTIAHRSDIFRDLCTLPRPENMDDTMDGCPVIRLHDPASDLRYLLLVICCGKNYYYIADEPQTVPFSALASLIRMGHKYAIHDVFNDALSRLKKYYTTDFDAWMDAQGRSTLVETTPIDAITLVRLAKLTDTTEVLSVAYLICCTLAPSTLVGSLESDDLVRILQGKPEVVRMSIARIISMLRVVATSSCLSPQICTSSIHRVVQRNSMPKWMSKTTVDVVFAPLDTWFFDQLGPLEMCVRCKERLRGKDGNDRRIFWRELPTCFGLPRLESKGL